MTDKYREAGVDIAAGDAASALAASAAKSTYAGRAGMIGMPVTLENGFAGALDFGDFYLVQCCDTVGTKIDLAAQSGDFSGLGHDLLAMVADDAICLGAEVISITNTFETAKVDTAEIGVMMRSLAEACQKQQIVIAGGEIAEVGKKISGTSWGADAVGIVKKERMITGDDIEAGDIIIALREYGFRCNGYSLVRKILREHAPRDLELINACLRPSTVYQAGLLSVIGRYGQKAKARIKGLAHITGGGIPGNLRRILKKQHLGALLTRLYSPPEPMVRLKELGGVTTSEFFEVWNAGNGMLLVCDATEAEAVISGLKKAGIESCIAGEVTPLDRIEIHAWNGSTLVYEK